MYQPVDYSTQSLAALKRLLPDLAALAVWEEDYFIISTTSPSGWPLWISSAEQELTVGFAEHHTHFGGHEGEPQEDATDAAEYVQQLRAGHLMIGVWYEGTEFISSVTQEVAGQPLPPTWFQRWWRRKQHQVLKKWAEY